MIRPLKSNNISSRIPSNARVQHRGIMKYIFDKFAAVSHNVDFDLPADKFCKAGEENYFYTLNA